MRKIYLICFVLHFQSSILFSQTPPPPAPEPEVKALLSGPNRAETGTLVKIFTHGTFGDDAKIDCVPPNQSWEPVRLVADNSVAIIFSTRVPGRYYFFLAVNKNGKTAIARHEILIEGSGPGPDPGPDPKPPPGPDLTELETKLRVAYDKDGKPAEKKAYLTATYDSFRTEKASNYKELETLLSSSVNKVFNNDQTILRNVRDVVQEYLGANFGRKASAPVDPKLQNQVFLNVVNTLNKIN